MSLINQRGSRQSRGYVGNDAVRVEELIQREIRERIAYSECEIRLALL